MSAADGAGDGKQMCPGVEKNQTLSLAMSRFIDRGKKLQLEKVNSSAEVNSTILCFLLILQDVFMQNLLFSAIMISTYRKILDFCAWETDRWEAVCETEFHRSH